MVNPVSIYNSDSFSRSREIDGPIPGGISQRYHRDRSVKEIDKLGEEG